MAPSGSNAQPWEFIVIRESAIKTRLRELYVDLWEAYKGSRIVRERSSLSLRARKALQAGDQFAAALERVPVHVVVVLNRTRMRIERDSDKDRVYPSSVYGSVFPAIELMMLSARALGVGTAVTTMLSPCEERVKQLLKIPEPHQVIALVPMGYPIHSFTRPFRQPVWSRIRKENWETPWTPTTRETTHER